ncbi:MAG TPA: YndJ family protein [Actinoplanes sp.]|nr:YndJ family protein [Actinoplanes sp.]
MTTLVHLIVVLGMVVIVPVGLRMVDDPHPLLHAARRYWPIAAAAGAASLWLPRGPVATALALGYALGAVLLVGYATARLLRRRSLTPIEVAVHTALLSPAVAAAALVAERAEFQLFGFKPTVLTLTVAHFHFAGFAAALIAGLIARVAGDGAVVGGRRAADAAALTVPAGTLLVLIGYFTGDAVELAGALVLTAGMWTVSWLTWRHGRTIAADRLTAGLLLVSAAILLASMVLAVSWAVGEATGLPHPSLAWMAATHGVANALGFALCAIVGWRRVGAQV